MSCVCDWWYSMNPKRIKDQVIEMAREAKWPNWDGDIPTDDHEFEDFTEPLTRFAHVVASHQHEMWKMICRLLETKEELLEALKHLEHNARMSGADMGLALDVAASAIAKAEKKNGSNS